MIAENLIYIILLLLGYFIVFTLMPAAYMQPVVKNKGLGYRLCFYNIFGILYISLCSYIMAYLHIYHPLSLWGMYFILPVLIRHIIIRDKVRDNILAFKKWYDNYNPRLTGRKMKLRSVRNAFDKFFSYFYKKYVSGRILQYICLIAVIVFIVYFFGYFKTHYYTYSFTDEETHLYWVSSLIHNNPFPAGLYPHGAHFISAAISTMFGLNETRIWLSFNVLSAVVEFTFGFITIRRFFKARGAAIFSVGFIVISGMIDITSYYRLHESVPMEIGMMAYFIMMYGLVDYAKTRERLSLILFGFGVAGTIDIHFYVTIFAVFSVLAYGIVYIIPLIKRKLFVKILICGLIAAISSFVPYAVGYMLGYEFERSIDWAMAIIEDSDRDTLYGTDDETAVSEEPESDTEITTADYAADDSEAITIEGVDLADDDLSSVERLISSIKYKVKNITSDLTGTFVSSMLWARILIGLLLFTCAYGLAGVIVCIIRKKETDRFLTYLYIAITVLIDLVFFSLASYGEFTIMNTTRSGTFMAIGIILLFAMPVEVVYDIFSLLPVNKKYIDEIIALLSLIGLGAYYICGDVKEISEQYYYFDCQDADMKLCQELVSTHENDTWTVVSPVNDLQAIRYSGYHYEVRDLLINLEKDVDIYIPTEDIYVVVENVIPNYGYGEKRMMDGSDFIEKSFSISAEEALKSLDELGFYDTLSDDRVYYDCRQGTMSKLYYWMMKIIEIYPDDVSVYYDDGKCTIYHITQDRYFLLNLNVDYTDLAQADYNIQEQ